MFNCKLCSITLYTAYICEDCSKISKLYEVYTKKVVLDGLEQLFKRTEKQINHKQNHIKLKDREK